MSNLTVENLKGFVQSGDVEGIVSGGRLQPPAAPETRAARIAAEEGLQASTLPAGESMSGFGRVLDDSIAKVNKDQIDADHAIKELIAGRNKNIHETMLTIERADTSLKMMMQVRNKVLEAYREVMKMQV